MAYNQKETIGRGNMPKTGRSIPLSMKSPNYLTEDPKIKTEQLQEVDLGVVKSKRKSAFVKNPYYGLSDFDRIRYRGGSGTRIPEKYTKRDMILPGQLESLEKLYGKRNKSRERGY